MKAIGLLSGGLDSILAIKLIKDQGIDVIAMHFLNPFMTETSKEKIEKVAKKLGVKVVFVKADKSYLNCIRKPRHGYGKHMNPCLDCRVFILKKAKQLAKKLNAQFVFTGEVLGERPMSQNKQGLMLVEKESGLKGKLIRPLSGKLLPETKWIEKNKLLDIQGRTRKRQLELAKKWKIDYYSSPAGGCLLTDKEFANKMRDLFGHEKNIDLKDIEILKYGRHFRFGKNKVIVGRNHEENLKLKKLKRKQDYVFECVGIPGPTTILQGPKTKKIIRQAARLTVRYTKFKKANVRYNKKIVEV